MVVTIGRNVGFEATGEIHIYDTDPRSHRAKIPMPTASVSSSILPKTSQRNAVIHHCIDCPS